MIIIYDYDKLVLFLIVIFFFSFWLSSTLEPTIIRQLPGPCVCYTCVCYAVSIEKGRGGEDIGGSRRLPTGGVVGNGAYSKLDASVPNRHDPALTMCFKTDVGLG